MTNTEKYNYLVMLSDYDIGTLEAMLREERWLYVATVCHWALQRLIKGMIVYHTKKEAPKSDNISFLLNRLSGNPEFLSSDAGRRFEAERMCTLYDTLMLCITI